MPKESYSPAPESVALTDKERLIEAIDKGMKRLPTLYAGKMDQRFDTNFPFSTQALGQRIRSYFSGRPVQKEHMPIKLDTLNGIPQKGRSDCVGASTISVFSTITGVTVTPDLYDKFLKVSIRRKMAVQEGEDIEVFPYVLNVLETSHFKDSFSSDVKVACRKGLSLSDISQIVKAAKERKDPYKLFILLPVASWNIEDNGHMVALQEIKQDEVVVYDPRIGTERTIPNDEFNKRWQYDNNRAIFIFAK